MCAHSQIQTLSYGMKHLLLSSRTAVVENEPPPEEGLERPLRKAPNTPILGLFPTLSGEGVGVIGQKGKKKKDKNKKAGKRNSRIPHNKVNLIIPQPPSSCSNLMASVMTFKELLM